MNRVVFAVFVAITLLTAEASHALGQNPADIQVQSAAVSSLKRSLAERFTVLMPFFESGAVGLTSDGYIAMRDPGALNGANEFELEMLILDDNNDRRTLYREIARLNGRPEWELRLQYTFAERWISRAPVGWFCRDSSGKWARKPPA